MSAIAIATRGIICPGGGGGSAVDTDTAKPELSTYVLKPDVYASVHLKPEFVSAEETDIANIPEMISADNLVPTMTSGTNLKPVMISAEEE